MAINQNIKPFSLRKISDAIHEQANHSVVGADGQVFVPIGKGGKAPENVEKKFTESEVKQIKNSAYQEGFEAGKNDGITIGQGQKLQQDQNLEQAWQKASAGLEVIIKDVDAFKKTAENFALNLSYDIAKSVIGEMLKEEPAKHIQVITSRCSDVLLEQPKITLFVNPEIENAAKEKISEFENKMNIEGRFTIKTNPDLGPNDCTMKWADGGSTNLMRERWAEIRNILGEKNLFSSSKEVEEDKANAAAPEESKHPKLATQEAEQGSKNKENATTTPEVAGQQTTENLEDDSEKTEDEDSNK